MLFSWLARRRAYKHLIDQEATALVEHEGTAGYYAARQIARAARDKGDRQAAKLWFCVTRRIADSTGLVPGRAKIGRPESEW